jgi:hypothetical protein
MKVVSLALLALVSVSPAAATATPVAKVISLLGDLQGKIIKEGEAAKATFDKFTEWCEDRNVNVAFEIKTAKSEINELKASIDKSASIITETTSKIEELTSSIATNEADLSAATKIREEEKTDFAAIEKELTECVDSLQRAVAILQREMRKSGAAFVQLHGVSGVIQAVKTMLEASMIGQQDAKVLTALVQNQQESSNDDTDGEFGAPAAAGYESKSGGIVETLEGLLDKALEQLDAARKKETTSTHNFEMLKQSLLDEVKFANKDLSESKTKIAVETESKKTAEGDLQVTTAGLKEDEEVIATLKQDCMTGSEDYEEGVKCRTEELAAVAKALEVLKEMTGGATDVTYSAASFLQISEASDLKNGADLANFEAVRFVRKLAMEQHSEALAQLARRMSSAIRYGGNAGSKDPFAKVKGLIEDMISKLEKDGKQDASHKAYCDKEMSETKEKKMEKDYAMDKLKTKIDKMTAKSAKLKEEVAEIQSALAEQASATAEATKIRNEERGLFNKNKPDMEGGLEGVKMALKVLKEYYSKGEGAQGAGSGIIGLLEVVESDFSKTLAEMTAQESTSQSDFETQMQLNEMQKKSQEKDVEYKTKEAHGLDVSTADAKSDLEGLQTETAAIIDYQSKLNEICIAKPETYSERANRRTAEIDGLKEALQILEGETVLLQGSARTGRKQGLRGAALEAAF